MRTCHSLHRITYTSSQELLRGFQPHLAGRCIDPPPFNLRHMKSPSPLETVGQAILLLYITNFQISLLYSQSERD